MTSGGSHAVPLVLQQEVDVDHASEEAWQAIRRTLAALRAEWCLLKAEAEERKANFNPAQPRVPRGHADGGQWTDDVYFEGVGELDQREATDRYGWVHVASSDGFGSTYIDLIDEDRLGGHTIDYHVGKSDAYLIRRLRGMDTDNYYFSTRGRSTSSFSSLAAANKLVSSTLALHQPSVNLVASGLVPRAQLYAEFRSATGRDAYRPSANSVPYIRTTFRVKVIIAHDRRIGKGYYVLTSYPVY